MPAPTEDLGNHVDFRGPLQSEGDLDGELGNGDLGGGLPETSRDFFGVKGDGGETCRTFQRFISQSGEASPL